MHTLIWYSSSTINWATFLFLSCKVISGNERKKMGFQQLFSLTLVVMLMTTMILQKKNFGRAAVVVKSSTTYRCDGLLINECRIADEDLESELDFLMDSKVIRILQQSGNNKVSSNALIATQAVQKGCKGSYTNCIANGGKANCKNIFACRGQL